MYAVESVLRIFFFEQVSRFVIDSKNFLFINTMTSQDTSTVTSGGSVSSQQVEDDNVSTQGARNRHALDGITKNTVNLRLDVFEIWYEKFFRFK